MVNKTKRESQSMNQPVIGRSVNRMLLGCLLFIGLSSCSDDAEAEPAEAVDPVDLTLVEGRYKGVWDWELGDGFISMVITPQGVADTYDVDYYESNNYRPRKQSDGVSPDARGELIVTGTTVSIDLFVNVDDPPCAGRFTGTGTLNDEGELDLTMNIDDCFAEDEPASWKLEKKENL